MLDPVAFWSYARHDDEASDFWLSDLRLALATELKTQTGTPFTIHQDRDDILWGQAWRSRIVESVDGSSFLIPVMSPSFLASVECRKEIERFLDRQQQLGRDDLILPIYYVSCPELEDASLADPNDRVIQALRSAQRSDWRSLRFSGLKTKKAKTQIAKMAEDLTAALARTKRDVATGQAPPAPTTSAATSGVSLAPSGAPAAGILDHMADLEEYFEDLTVNITRIGELLKLVGEEATEFTASPAMLTADTGRKRVAFMANFNRLLEPYVADIESEATAYTDRIQRADEAVDGVLSHLMEQSPSGLAPDEREGVREFLDSVSSLEGQAAEAMESLDGLGEQVTALGGLTKVIRPTTSRMRRALAEVTSSRETLHSWSFRASEVRKHLGL